MPPRPPSFAHLQELLAQIHEVEAALAHLLGDGEGLLAVDGLGRLLDERDDVSHAEDAIGDAGRMEILERVDLLAHAHQLDGLAGDGAHRERGAAAPVAVDAGEHDAGEVEPSLEGPRGVDGVLAGQRVGDEQCLMRVGRGLDLRHLVHQLVVDRGAAGRVEHDHVVTAEARRLDRAPCDLHDVLPGDDRQSGNAGLASEHGKLLHGGRPAGVERGHQHTLALPVGEALGDLRRRRGLAGALQAHHQDGHGRHRVERNRFGLGAERLDQRVVHDLHDHLAGGHRFHHLRADGARAQLVGEGTDHVERDIGLEQRAAHLAQRFADIRLGQGAAAGELIEDAGKSRGKAVEHDFSQ